MDVEGLQKSGSATRVSQLNVGGWTTPELRFLLEASDLLASSLDANELLQGLARLTVPFLADWCLIDVLDREGRLQGAAHSHRDAALAEHIAAMRRKYPPAADHTFGGPLVVRTGEPWIVPRMDEQLLGVAATDDEHLAMLRVLAPGSCVVAPITARGRVIGTISLVADDCDRLGESDLPLVREVARRAAQAIEQARLYEAEAVARHAAEAAADRALRLQRVSAGLARAMTPEDVAAVAVDHGIGALDATAGAMVLLTHEGELEVVRSLGYEGKLLEGYRRFPLSANVPLAEAVRNCSVILVESRPALAERYPQLAASADNLGTRGAWAALPLMDDGRAIGAMGFSFDGERRFDRGERAFMSTLASQCTQALERARLYQEVQQASAAKSEFLAVMSHELRTPLNAIVGYSQLLADGIAGPVSAVQEEHLGRVRYSAEHLLALIEEILTLSRIEAGREEVARGEVDVVEIAREALQIVEKPASDKGLKIVSQLPENLTIQSDAVKLRQVLINLLSNAVKFTESGTVTLTVERNGDEILLRVRDTGMGISQEDLVRIFDRFWRAKRTRGRTSGTGLGLSVTRQLCRLLGGDISVESVERKGSTFTVRLPGK